MKTQLFHYDLPEGLIAAEPVAQRDESRLMRVDRRSGRTDHYLFRDIVDLLRPDDLLVVNNSRVFPARLYGHRLPGGAKVEALLLREESLGRWWAMVKPGKKVREGDRLVFGPDVLHAKVEGHGGKGERLLSFEGAPLNLIRQIEQIGVPPLPPYILKERKRRAEAVGGDGAIRGGETPEDKFRYQTVYAQKNGSVAAPTAGLHFTEELMGRIRSKGVEIVEVTLHVGSGTFKPVAAEYVEDHIMHSERYYVDGMTAGAINRAKRQGRRVVAVGTTCVRTLETIGRLGHEITGGAGETNIMITPGFKFNVVDALITNFHLPCSTLLMLVYAFGGHIHLRKAYETAIQEKYRFYSYGDAMLIE